LFNGYCRLCFHLRAALLYVGFHRLSLHVSAYMAIFQCVGFFIYLFSYAAFFSSLPFFHVVTLCMFLFVFFFGVFCLLILVVFDCSVLLERLISQHRPDKNHNKGQAKTPKNTKQNSTGTKHKRTTCRVWPCEKKAASQKKQQSRILKHKKINIRRILHT
jgi:hypothetical protein